jgi:hypothetical protein
MPIDPSSNASNPPVVIPGCLYPPHPAEIHQSPLTITWIQEIYSQLAYHSAQLKSHDSLLAQMQVLMQKNQELQLALDQAQHEIAQLKLTATQTSSIHLLLRLFSTEAPMDPLHFIGQIWLPKPPMEESSVIDHSKTKSTTPKVPSPTKSNPESNSAIANKSTTKAESRCPMTLDQVNRLYTSLSETHGVRNEN